jgi:hypothetical protein
MSDTKERFLPGTAITYADSGGEKGFSKIEMLIAATGGLSLSQVCAVTGLEGSTIQNWVKRGWVANPKGKKYGDSHIARILIINALKECIKLEHISILMAYVNNASTGSSGETVKESDLFNFLCDALEMDLSKGGVEAVVETVIKDYEGLPIYEKIRKALAVMIYACVCTDVKRRTEMMMSEILSAHNNPETEKPQVQQVSSAEPDEPDTPQESDAISAVSADALSEESAESDDKSADSEEGAPDEPVSKSITKPWYFRKDTAEENAPSDEASQVQEIHSAESAETDVAQESDMNSLSSDVSAEKSTQNEEEPLNDPTPPPKKAANKPWYFRKGPKA